jgi:transglutaminase-like putative cysteine protease
MSSGEPRAAKPSRTRRTDLALAAGVLVALVAAMLPLLRVVSSGPWLTGAVAVAAVVLGAGFAVRWFRGPGIVVSLVEIVVWAALLTAAFGRDTALLWVIPTFDTFSLGSLLLQSASEDIALGAAPLDAGPALSFLIVGAVGVLAIMIDHVVVTARMPLLAAVGLVAISLIPSIAVPGEVDLVAFALLGASILFLLGVDTRARHRGTTPPSEEPSRGAGTASATAVGIGVVAVVVALVATPLLPSPLARAGGMGTGAGGSTIDPSLELGDDLRQPGAVEVLRMRWSGDGAPYLRVATLSQFDGSVWDPDEGATAPLDEDGADLPRTNVDGGVEVLENRASVEIVDLNSRWAPVTYPAIDVTGLDGQWRAMPGNGTVLADGESVQGQTYDVVSALPEPTLEQIRGTEAGGTDDEAAYDLPREMPEVIAATAAEVAADAGSDYDALVALQSWFRGSNFGYSLDAPVADGFDGTGVDAIADFLTVREGYCVHFASAFAVMARTMGMPSRIVVGYLPGTSSSEQVEGETVYSVQSTQLHAWPEVHFEGIGWVPFEPTNSLGTPTSFASGATSAPGSSPSQAPEESAAAATPTPTSSAGGLAPEDRELGATGMGGSAASDNPWPSIFALVVVALLLAPGVFRAVRRRRRLAAARRGDAAAAWLSVQELALDLGIPVPAAESPRAFGARLAAQRGAEGAAMDTLVAAIEHASYAGEDRAVAGERLADAVTAASAGLLDTVSPSRRLLVRMFPRSLVVRPGGAYAGTLPPRPRETFA